MFAPYRSHASSYRQLDVEIAIEIAARGMGVALAAQRAELHRGDGTTAVTHREIIVVHRERP